MGIKHFYKTIHCRHILMKLNRGTLVESICVDFGIGSSMMYDINHESNIKFYAANDTMEAMTIQKLTKAAAHPDVIKILM